MLLTSRLSERVVSAGNVSVEVDGSGVVVAELPVPTGDVPDIESSVNESVTAVLNGNVNRLNNEPSSHTIPVRAGVLREPVETSSLVTIERDFQDLYHIQINLQSLCHTNNVVSFYFAVAFPMSDD